MISGYSLTGEKCTVREPSQPGSKAVRTGLFQLASQFESGSVSALSILNVWLVELGHHPTQTHHTALLQNMSVTYTAAHMAMISMEKMYDSGLQ